MKLKMYIAFNQAVTSERAPSKAVLWTEASLGAAGFAVLQRLLFSRAGGFPGARAERGCPGTRRLRGPRRGKAAPAARQQRAAAGDSLHLHVYEVVAKAIKEEKNYACF